MEFLVYIFLFLEVFLEDGFGEFVYVVCYFFFSTFFFEVSRVDREINREAGIISKFLFNEILVYY